MVVGEDRGPRAAALSVALVHGFGRTGFGGSRATTPKGTDKAMWHRPWAGMWGGWVSLGGVNTSNISCTAVRPDTLDCFARGSSGALFQRAWR